MREFVFTKGSLEAQGLQEGDKVECTYSDVIHFTAGVLYSVYKVKDGLYVKDNDGDPIIFENYIKFKPIQVNIRYHRWFLQDILTACKEGDELRCVNCSGSLNFTVGCDYQVHTRHNGDKYVISDRAQAYSATSTELFIKKDVQPNCTQTRDEHDMNQHDSWSIGKSYSAPKKEWHPDVMDVDLTKKIGD